MTTATANAASRVGEGPPRARSASAGGEAAAAGGAVSGIASQVVQELAPQVAGRLLEAVAHRVSTSVDDLTSRLETVAAEGGAQGAGGLKAALTGRAPAAVDGAGSEEHGEPEKLPVSSRVQAGLGFVIQQAIHLLELVKQWVMRLVAAAQQRLGRGSPEGISLDEHGGDHEAEDEDVDGELDQVPSLPT